MTVNEQKTIDRLYDLMSQIRKENETFRNEINVKVNKVNSAPINLEADILRTLQSSMNEAIKKSLTDSYDSPLKKLMVQIVDANSKEIKDIVGAAFQQSIRTEDFKNAVLESCSHKVARSIMSNMDSIFEKVSNELKQDPTFKAKATIAISNVITEILSERNKKL